MRRFLPVLFTLLVASTATAQELGDDEVALKNGGSIRGTVVSVIPGESVKIIESGSTESKTLPWSEVADVQKGKYAKKATAEPGGAGKGYQEPVSEPRGAGGVHVHIDSPEPANLMRIAATSVGVVGNYLVQSALVEGVCSSPCDQDVPPGQYYVAGDYPNTSQFTLSGGAANIVVKPGSTGRRVGGFLAVSLGGAAVATGLLVVLLGPTLGQECHFDADFNDVCTGDVTPYYAGGGVAIGLGAAGIVGGAILLATSGSSAEVKPGATVTTTATVMPWIAPVVGDAAHPRSAFDPTDSVYGVRASF